MPTCAQCGNHFGGTIIIGGQKKNLRRRKKCLDCLPFKQPREFNIDKFRERKRNNAYRWYWKNKKLNGSCPVNDIRKKNREILVRLAGAKCQHCGYSKYSGNLVFHHLNGEDKKFELSTRALKYKFDRVIIEAAKCSILCHNCHGETHNDIIGPKLPLTNLLNYMGKSWADFY